MRSCHAFIGSLLLLMASLVWAGCAGAERSTAAVDRETAIITEGPPPVTEEPTRDTSVEMPSLADIMPEPRLDTVQARRFDQGRLWTFDFPPVDYFRETYNFDPDTTWFAQARLGALRIPGCTASFASPHGLMLTNHHCGRDYLPGLSRSDENLLRDGFYATSLDEERRVEGLYAEQLVAIDDVTEEVHAALDAAQTDAERADALQTVTASIQERLLAERDGSEAYRVQLIALYNGGKYSAYTFRRYTDVRLVMAPEAQIGFFGGEADNFTYPRYSLDMMLFRVYDGGRPLATEHYFPWSNEGPYEGQAVFVVGNPGSSYRLETVAQLNFRGEVQAPALYRLFVTRSDALQPVFEATQEEALRNELVSLGNAEKAYGGFVEALNDPYLMARIQDREQAFIAELQSDSVLQAQYGNLHDRIAAIQDEKQELAAEYGAFLLLRPGAPYGSVTLQRGLVAYDYLHALDAGAPAERLEALRDQLLALEDLPEGMDAAFLQERLRDFEHYLGADHAIVEAILQGRSAEAAAEALREASVLASAASTREAVEAEALSSDDPVVQAVAAFMPDYQAYQSAITGLQAQEADLARQLGRARFDVYGTDVPPDATFSLRISDGVVRPYEYNGTIAPTVTTFNGMYDLYHAFGDGTDWDLPERWLNPPESFALSTPVNFVATNDILGGNSGSAVLNQSLELVGLAFDGNIESLSGPYIYRTDGPRMVAVDVRGMLEALDEIYGADRIVIELMSGERIDTEAEAEAAAASSR